MCLLNTCLFNTDLKTTLKIKKDQDRSNLEVLKLRKALEEQTVKEMLERLDKPFNK